MANLGVKFIQVLYPYPVTAIKARIAARCRWTCETLVRHTQGLSIFCAAPPSLYHSCPTYLNVWFYLSSLQKALQGQRTSRRHPTPCSKWARRSPPYITGLPFKLDKTSQQNVIHLGRRSLPSKSTHHPPPISHSPLAAGSL